MPPSTVSPFQHMPQPLQHQQAPQQQQQQQAPQNNQPFFPSLHLYPLNDSFVPKQIALSPQHGRVKIGRQTNARTVPGERNGYFDSKVLSRQHAEIWEEGGKIFIKDVKSSNGTFINGERLSPEGVESEPFELKTDDTVEFGIDIVGEDNKTIIHHKVAAKVVVVLGPEDLANIPVHHQPGNRRSLGAQLATQAVQNSALGGMGAGAPRQGKSGLTFDHLLSRLQNELLKSRETGGELTQLNGTMNDIQESLGGALPQNLPPYPAQLPPVRPPPLNTDQQPAAAQPAVTSNAVAVPAVDNASTLNSLQSQLQDTQSVLQQHLEKIRSLETYVNEQETLKAEVNVMRNQMEERKREVEILLMQRRRDDEDEMRFSRRRSVHDDDDDDDARSVSTVGPEDENDEERRQRREELGRPRTPEPTGHMLDDEYEEERRAAEAQAAIASKAVDVSAASLQSVVQPPPAPSVDLSEVRSQNAALTTRLDMLTAQLDSAMELSRTLQTQAMLAQSTIAELNAKVGTLEAYVIEQKEKAAIAAAAPPPPPPPAPPVEPETEPEPVVAKNVWEEWRTQVENTWKTTFKSERETWASERERLANAVKEWENRTVELERKEEARTQREEAEAAGFEHDSDSGEEGGGSSESFQSEGRIPPMMNGFPSPRKGGRKRKHHRTNGNPIPSPHSSPTSSSSFYPTHTRRSTSPTSEEPDPTSHFGKGKLPISPPTTSPGSRAGSIALNGDDGEQEEDDKPTPNGTTELKSEPSEDGGELGLINGEGKAVAPSPSPLALPGQPQQQPNPFLDSASAFVAQNGLGPGGPTLKQQFGEIPVMHLSAAGVVLVGMAAWAMLTREHWQ